ncbi:MAG: hypothetical protein CMP22_06715 [Rickettsiales bacterium]|nr:hypothetical protein [Rickettsiales bacterium]|tara:strand:+ start:3458 stop:3922 length:465 start_codon:yes stop_codon:yes gene_type:complete
MKQILKLFTFILMSMTLSNCSNADTPAFFDQYMWQYRPIVLLVKAESNQDYKDQMAQFDRNKTALKDRDIKLIRIIDGQSHEKARVYINDELKPNLQTNVFFEHFQINPDQDQFTLILIGKDGGVKLKQNQFVPLEQITGLIDSMPMRKKEMRQ